MAREEHTDDTAQIPDATEKNNIRRYWFVGGLAAGLMGAGTVGHWGMALTDVGLILVGALLILAISKAKRERGWNV